MCDRLVIRKPPVCSRELPVCSHELQLDTDVFRQCFIRPALHFINRQACNVQTLPQKEAEDWPTETSMTVQPITAVDILSDQWLSAEPEKGKRPVNLVNIVHGRLSGDSRPNSMATRLGNRDLATGQHEY